MFKFIHAADIHLDSPLRGLERYEGAPVEPIRQATRRALENLVELALQQAADFLLIAGDLYDGDWKDFRTGLFFVSQMHRLREAGIPVYLIAGNHDAANKITRRLQLPDNVTLFPPNRPETAVVESCDVAIHGQSFARSAVTENLAAGYPSADPGLFNIGLLHTAATGCEGHEPYAPCDLDDLRNKHYDYWALGHVHKQQALATDPPILFSGNLQGRHIREAGPKGCLLVSVDDDQRVHWEPRALDVFRWVHCSLDARKLQSGYELVDTVQDRLAAIVVGEDRPLAVRVEVTGPCPGHRDLAAEPLRWTQEIRAAGQQCGEVWIEKVLLATRPPQEFDPGGAAEGPIAELLESVAEYQRNPSRLAELVGQLADLCNKLPAELREGPEALGLDQPELVAGWLDQVEPVLRRELYPQEEGK